MLIDIIENYDWNSTTEVKHEGEWTGITEVWFREKKVGLKNSGRLVGYREITDIRG